MTMEVSCIVASEFGLCRRDMKPGGLLLQQDQMEFVKARCEPASMSRVRARQEGAQCTTSEVREMRSMTGSLHWVTGGT